MKFFVRTGDSKQGTINKVTSIIQKCRFFVNFADFYGIPREISFALMFAGLGKSVAL